MAFVAFDDVVAIHVRAVTFSGKPLENVYYGRKLTGTVSQADCDALANVIDARVGTDLLGLWHAAITYVETYVRDLTTEISFQATNNGAAGAGTRSGTGVEDHSSLLGLRRSGLVGRSANGRVYTWGGVVADRTSQSTWGTTYANAWVSTWADIDSDIESEGFLPVIISPTLREAGNPTLTSTFPIVSWAASLNIAAVRARSTPA